MKTTNEILTVKQIAAIIGYTDTTIRERIKKIGFSPEFTRKGISYYSYKIIDIIIKSIEIKKKTEPIQLYYPVYIQEQFYIYESKMNTPEKK
jgi:UDP-glucose 6-dehydrogenase